MEEFVDNVPFIPVPYWVIGAKRKRAQRENEWLIFKSQMSCLTLLYFSFLQMPTMMKTNDGLISLIKLHYWDPGWF